MRLVLRFGFTAIASALAEQDSEEISDADVTMIHDPSVAVVQSVGSAITRILAWL